MANAVIKAMPTKKFYGSYYDGYWKYPNLKIDWQESTYYGWINFTLDNWNSITHTEYDEAKLTDFKWYSDSDCYLRGEEELP